MQEHREQLINRLREDLMGPRKGEKERYLQNETPHTIYSLGILFPKVGGAVGLGAPSEDSVDGVGNQEPEDSPLAPILQRRPVTAGMTFAVVPGSKLEVQVQCGFYAHEDDVDHPWYRIPIPAEKICIDRDSSKKYDVLLRPQPSDNLPPKPAAELHVRWRTVRDQEMVTLTLVNVQTPKNKENPERTEPEDCLYQVQMEVTCTQGSLAPPPAPLFAVDAEEEELRLRYRDRIQWATGHGCSASWPEGTGPSTPPTRINLDFLPVAIVHKFLPDRPDGAVYAEEVLNIENLSRDRTGPELFELLQPFVDDFKTWLDRSEAMDVPAEYSEAAGRILDRLREQHRRLHQGLHVLRDGDSLVLRSFQLANAAILDQMEMMAKRTKRPFDRSAATWRPFQLAFQLLTIPGIVSDGEDSGRDLVDLIWFPTGGGKTEAYLMLMAFTIVYRRMMDPERGSGTAVISRYTLRLLTQDQFTRTSTLICCLELMRQTGRIPGQDEISIGLWIGGGAGSAPNTFKEAALRANEQIQASSPVNNFMLECCPACGTRIVPEQGTQDPSDFGYRADEQSFEFYCPNERCSFHDRLPIQVVDEALYEKPPSVLLGTIDKFARMTWDHRSRSFFGWGPVKTDPPDLVIQDELHLISGPLGSVAALYEAAMDVVLHESGRPPKYVAATATIRGAADQVQSLYARPVAVFPAPGMNSSDSYFMREDKDDSRARAYVGYMGQAHHPVTCGNHLMASALQGAKTVTDGDDYWTLAVYHNSKRELGKTMKEARDSVPKRMELMLHHDEVLRDEMSVIELSGNVKGSDLPRALSDLHVKRDELGSVDLVACTNMISVGVDVSRLNLMVVLGQPKTTAEYIQATSRVGRSSDSSGVVVACLSATRPRDRAHYESFLGFHSGYYRWVEPSSVTPGSPGACTRALHAALVTAIRLTRLPRDDAAKSFSRDEHQDLIHRLRSRLISAVSEKLQDFVGDEFDKVTQWWADASEEHENLRYDNGRKRQFPALLAHFGSDLSGPQKPTLSSMRNVEQEVAAKVRAERSRHGEESST